MGRLAKANAASDSQYFGQSAVTAPKAGERLRSACYETEW